jgi:DNA mismatch repair protein MutL
MPRINILTEDTANKIAAGEIIERPSSVVKELVENSIDAGARKISVELQSGGKGFIRVTDDGCGMSPDDALLCLERHATSKISNASDLGRIRTLGFRGEAIPSIAAVSKMEIVTRSPGEISAARVVIEGGVIKSVGEKGAPVGTQVTVRQLFFNIPVRLKFMKRSATELGHSTSMIQKQALANPEMHFRLVAGSRETLNLPPAASIIDRIAVVWGNEIAGGLCHGEIERDGLRLTAYFGTPALTRSNRNLQFFFMNRRPITNRLLGKALADAYRGSVMIDRFPVAFIFIDIEPSLVDVNIHPSKREVKFVNPNSVFDALGAAFGKAFLRTYSKTYAGTSGGISGSTGREARVSYAPSPLPGAATIGQAPPSSVFQSVRMADDDMGPALSRLEEMELMERSGHPRFHEASTPVAVSQAKPTADFSAISQSLTFIKQIFGSYLLCVEGDDLFIVDQHALHERLVYDELISRESPEEATTQQLLIPMTFELAPDRAEVLSDHLDLFAALGVEIRPFGPRTFAITALAEIHAWTHGEKHVLESVLEGLDELYSGLNMKAPRAKLERLIIISACKNSIKAGESVSNAEAEGLLKGLKTLAQPPTCLHGRPLVLRLNESQIARAFGRKG